LKLIESELYREGYFKRINFISSYLLNFLEEKIKNAANGISCDKFDYSYYQSIGDNYSLSQKFLDSESHRNNLRKISRLHKDPEIKSEFINFLNKKLSLEGKYKISIFRFTAFRKPPKSEKSLSFHQDIGMDWDSSNEKNLYVLWIPFVYCNKNNGSLMVFAKSHHKGVIGNGTHLNDNDLDLIKKSHELHHVEANRGDVIFFDPKLVHGSGSNLDNKERWAINVLFSINKIL